MGIKNVNYVFILLNLNKKVGNRSPAFIQGRLMSSVSFKKYGPKMARYIAKLRKEKRE